MLSRRAIIVQQENLLSICRISVKALLDYACLYTDVDDDSEVFINFCAVLEHMVSHRLRPNQKKVWLPGPGSPRHFWDVLLDAQARTQRQDPSRYFQSCVPNIDAIECFKSSSAKFRAFVRVALMEKRLSDYMLWILDHQDMLRQHYLEGAVMLSEQVSVLCGDLIGLNAIDFNFCLKGNENELLGPLEISYSRFLRYKQTAASRTSDEIEMLRLTKSEEDGDQGSVSDSVLDGNQQTVLTETSVNDLLRLQQLERDFRAIKEQKDYLEELARLRERQVVEANARLEGMKAELLTQQKQWDKERRTMDSCILELQADMTKLYQQNERQRFQLASYKQFKERLGQKEVQLDDMAVVKYKTKDGSSQAEITSQTTKHHSSSLGDSQHSTDRRSLLSVASENVGEDSQSMVPLTGSLADVNVAMLESKDAVVKRMSQWDKDDSHLAEVDDVQTSTSVEAPTGYSSDMPHQSIQPEAIPIMMESFVVTEDRTEMERVARQVIASHDGGDIVDVKVHISDGEIVSGEVADECGDVGAVVRDGGEEAWDQAQAIDQGDKSSSSVPQTSDTLELNKLDNCPEHAEDLNKSTTTSEPEELVVVTSDPEILDPSNMSSDSSDAAWEIVSDSEQAMEEAEEGRV